MTQATAFHRIRSSRIIAILRSDHPQHLVDACHALSDVGVVAAEVSLTTPGALRAVETCRAQMEGLSIGAGSVLDPSDAEDALAAGAEFLVAPHFDERVVEIALDAEVPVLAGGFTPSEVVRAWKAGASWVKVFPADLGGPSYLKALKAPLQKVPLAAVGGVDAENAAAYLAAGADVLGVGGGLVPASALRDGDMRAIVQTARDLLQAVEGAPRPADEPADIPDRAAPSRSGGAP
jgi:2-dehydro-3-deoxyphosphogluconate aldolase/(4S)-4-hydroxy-2-oxoglutarate aldolase